MRLWRAVSGCADLRRRDYGFTAFHAVSDNEWKILMAQQTKDVRLSGVDEEPDRPGSPAIPMLIIVGVIALVGAVAAYAQERPSHSGGEPNYALALLLLGAGAFMLLLAAIVSSGRRR